MGFMNFSFKGFIENYTIPLSGVYIISAWGASGGGTNKPRGAFSISYAFINKGSLIHILVGESGGTGKPGDASYEKCGGGGGGTFISIGDELSTSSPLCVAGGGGSQTFTETINNYSHGQSTKIGGDPGKRYRTAGSGGLQDIGSSGGGFYSNGVKGTSGTIDAGNFGISFLNGGERIAATSSYPSAYGGFGGGASTSGHCGYPQGGGGYSGGSSFGGATNNGGGGGSFHLDFAKYSGMSIAGFDFMPNYSNSNLMQGNEGNGYVSLLIVDSKTIDNSCFYYRIYNLEIYLFLTIIVFTRPSF